MKVWMCVCYVIVIAYGGTLVSIGGSADLNGTAGGLKLVGAAYICLGIFGIVSAIYVEKFAVFRAATCCFGVLLFLAFVVMVLVAMAMNVSQNVVIAIRDNESFNNPQIEQALGNVTQVLDEFRTDCCNHVYDDPSLNVQNLEEVCDNVKEALNNKDLVFDCSADGLQAFKNALAQLVLPILSSVGNWSTASAIFTIMSVVFSCCLACSPPAPPQPAIVYVEGSHVIANNGMYNSAYDYQNMPVAVGTVVDSGYSTNNNTVYRASAVVYS
jgi:hypothetical protein